MLPGGCIRNSTRASSSSPAATTSSSAAAGACRKFGTGAGMEWLTGGSYGREVQGGRSPLLRIFRVFQRAGRDDSQRSVLLRNRSQAQGQVGDPGASLPLAVVGARAASSRAHAEKPLRTSLAQWAASCAIRRRPTAPRPSPTADPSFTKSAEQSWGPIASTSVTNSWCQTWDVENLFVTDGGSVRFERGQESDAHHHGLGVARCRSYSRAHAAQGHLDGSANDDQVGAHRERRLAVSRTGRRARRIGGGLTGGNFRGGRLRDGS